MVETLPMVDALQHKGYWNTHEERMPLLLWQIVTLDGNVLLLESEEIQP